MFVWLRLVKFSAEAGCVIVCDNTNVQLRLSVIVTAYTAAFKFVGFVTEVGENVVPLRAQI
jgi:hypothetical protein